MNIYETIGGGPAVDAAVTEFYRRVLADARLASYFEGIDMTRLARHQRAFLTAALGGPEVYSGRDLAASHQPLRISDGEFDLVLTHLTETLRDLGVGTTELAAIGERVAPLREQIVAASPAS